ncbi:MAG: hypothetical protein ACOC0D_02225, partial [Spirochaeta sp.]
MMCTPTLCLLRDGLHNPLKRDGQKLMIRPIYSLQLGLSNLLSQRHLTRSSYRNMIHGIEIFAALTNSYMEITLIVLTG